MSRIFLSVVAALAVCGCSLKMGDFTLIASENVKLETDVIRRSVEARDCTYMFLSIIPLGSLNPNAEEAMDRAMAEVPEGNVMTNVAIYNDIVTTFVLNQTCLRVKGDVGTLR